MKITLYPQRRDDELALSKQGDVLTVNGTEYDMSAIPDGATLPATAIENTLMNGGPIERIDGEINLTLFVPCCDPDAFMKPPVTVTISKDGAIEVPVFDAIKQEDAPDAA